MNEEDYIKKTKKFIESISLDIIHDSFVFDEVNSTNLKAKELLKKNAKHGSLITSKIQKKGRGRLDRNWESPKGGLYFSIILKPECKAERATLLPLIGALSICKTITDLSDLYVKIKWPNDVLINDKKVSGILLETEFAKDKIKYVILGIGINLNTDISALGQKLKSNSTSISYEIGIKLDYHDFFRKILINLDKYYTMFDEKQYDKIILEWKNNSDTLGKKITIDSSSGKINATAMDIDESGFLIVKTDDGEIKKITSGDCFYFD